VSATGTHQIGFTPRIPSAASSSTTAAPSRKTSTSDTDRSRSPFPASGSPDRALPLHATTPGTSATSPGARRSGPHWCEPSSLKRSPPHRAARDAANAVRACHDHQRHRRRRANHERRADCGPQRKPRLGRRDARSVDGDEHTGAGGVLVRRSADRTRARCWRNRLMPHSACQHSGGFVTAVLAPVAVGPPIAGAPCRCLPDATPFSVAHRQAGAVVVAPRGGAQYARLNVTRLPYAEGSPQRTQLPLASSPSISTQRGVALVASLMSSSHAGTPQCRTFAKPV
jgi:hypothetical protein